MRPTGRLFIRLDPAATARPLPQAVPATEWPGPRCRTSVNIAISPDFVKASTITNSPATSGMTDQDTPRITCQGLVLARTMTTTDVKMPVTAVGRPSCQSSPEAVSKTTPVTPIPQRAVLAPGDNT